MSRLRYDQAMNAQALDFDDLPTPDGSPGMEHVARLLSEHASMESLSGVEAAVVASYMVPLFFPADTTFIREGDSADTGFMVLVVEGDVVAERVSTDPAEAVTIRVMGPGSILGEVGLVDNEPRSASCTASTDVWCVILTRDALQEMIENDSKVAARLLLLLSANIASMLRDNSRQLKMYAGLTAAMRDELAQLNAAT
jgi:CRP-like cAMP-binding protein